MNNSILFGLKAAAEINSLKFPFQVNCNKKFMCNKVLNYKLYE